MWGKLSTIANPQRRTISAISAAAKSTRGTTTKQRLSEPSGRLQKQTQPLINYYEEKGILVTLDGTKDINVVFEDIKAVLAKFA